MNGHILLTTLLSVAMLTGAGASSESDVNKCSDAEGHILLTDQACGAGYAALPANSLLEVQATDAAGTEQEADHATQAEPVRADEVLAVIVALRPLSPGNNLRAKDLRRALAGDVDTLKQARLAMAADDAASAQRRALRD